MKKFIFLAVFFVILLSASLALAGMMTPDESFWNSIECDGIKVDIMVNHRTVAEPTLFIKNGEDLKSITLQKDACFSELKCVNYKGNSAVHFVESSCGNAYEIYWVIDLHSFQKYELNYETAKKLGFVDY